jgi:hypothetical protein
MRAAVEAAHGPLQRCDDPRGEVAKNFRFPGFRGTVSFITSMTKAFCSGGLSRRGMRSLGTAPQRQRQAWQAGGGLGTCRSGAMP